MSVESRGQHVGTLSEGDCFGETALLTGAARNATVTCASKSCRLLSIDGSAFVKLMTRSTALQRGLSAISAARTQTTLSRERSREE